MTALLITISCACSAYIAYSIVKSAYEETEYANSAVCAPIPDAPKKEEIESAYEWIKKEQEKDKARAAENLKKPRKYNVPGMFCPVKYANITYDGTERKNTDM